MVNIIYFDLLTNKALFQIRDIVGLFRLTTKTFNLKTDAHSQ